MKHLLLSLYFSIFILFAFGQTIVRGPYMQTQTAQSIILKWRTNTATSTKIWYGLAPNALVNEVSNSAQVTNHTYELTGLQAYTKYYYAVGNLNTQLAGADTNHYFFTAPLPYTEQNIRVWATGDFGKGNQCQIDVKESFQDYTRSQNVDPDLWIWLGDNAYNDGSDSEYQGKVFGLNGYSDIFSWMPFYPSPGNHDYNTIWSQNGILGIPYTLTSINDHDGPYYDMVDVPEQAEAGGYPSTHEVFYSYDYGNTHFLSLNSEVYAVGSNNVLNQMKTFITNDLSQNDKTWTIAYWHQPPYSKGSHDSDDFYEIVMETMREEIVPLLESFDVDMIICGHSHVYERSYLLNGHYGLSNSLSSSMILDNSNGNKAQGNAYIKDAFASTPQGTVYSVVGNAGSSEDTIFGSHPAMAFSYSGSGNCGSLILDIYKNELRGRHLTIQGNIIDDFSIIKQNMSINAGADEAICQHDSVLLTANITKGSDSLQYVWMPGNLTGNSIWVSPNTTTTYTLTVTDLLSGQVETDSRIVTINPIPNAVTIFETNGVLSVPSGFIYKWYRNGNLIPAANSNTYTPSLQGDYTVEVLNAAGCSVFSAVYFFYSLNIDIISDKNEICEGDSIILYLSVTGGSDSISVAWVNINGGSSSFYYTPLNSQEIVAEGTDYITNNYESDTLNIIVHSLPNQATITQNGNVISTDYYPNWSYKWFYNNMVFPSPNASQITVNQAGNYAVEVTDENGCKSLSNNFEFAITGIRDLEFSEGLIFPNPNEGKFTIKTKETIIKVAIFNYEGKLVYTNDEDQKEISLKDLSPGVYLLELTTTTSSNDYKFIIE